MEARRTSTADVQLLFILSEAVVLHEVLAAAEFADDLDTVALGKPAGKKVVSDVQRALAPLVPDLGAHRYALTVQDEYASIDPSP